MEALALYYCQNNHSLSVDEYIGDSKGCWVGGGGAEVEQRQL